MESRKVATSFCLFGLLWVCASAAKNVSDDRQVRRIIENDNRLSSSGDKRDETANHIAADKEKKQNVREQKWISELFVEAEQKFDLHPDASPRCKADYQLYKLHLSNQSIWAVRMMESSQWPSVGLFAGTVDHFGNYDECLVISSHRVKGQYCLARATYNIINATAITKDTPSKENFHQESSAWEAIEAYLDNPVRIDRHKLSWALCLPSTCKNTDLWMSLNRTLQPLFRKNGLNINIEVQPNSCMVKESHKYPLGYYYTIALFAVLFSLVIAASIHEVVTRKNLKLGNKESTSVRMLRCFSAVGNIKKLAHYSPEKDFILIHLSKVLNILMVIYGHRFIFFIGYPKFNAEGIESYYRASSIELIHTNVVDAFFSISGFLSFHFGFLPMLKGGGLYFVLNILFRWIRLVPVFMLLLVFIVNVLPYMGDGPLWNHRVLGEAAKCQSSWWANLLIVNNIVNPKQQCLVVSWYISVDIQLTILGTILLFAITRNRAFGTTLSILSFIAATVTTFIVAYINNFHGLLLLYMGLLEEPRRSDEFNYFYIAPYTRAGPYLIGFFAGFIIKVLKEKNYKFSNKQLVIFGLGSILIGEGSQFYGCLFYIFDRKYDRVENAIYASINRSLFAFPYAVVSILYFTSGLGFVQKIVERKIFVPLGRLTYSVFLVNTILQLYHASSQKTVMPSTSRMNLYWWAVADVFNSYIAGLILHLLAEAPITHLSKLLQGYIVSLFLKKNGDVERTEKADSVSGDDKSTQCSSKHSSPELNGGKAHQNGYHNHSFVNNEYVPNVSENSKI